MRRDLAELPKAHLHLHVENAMRRDTLEELCDLYGVAVPPTGPVSNWEGLETFHIAATSVIRSCADLVRLIDEVAQDSASDGAVWIEPQFYAPKYRRILGSDSQAIRFAAEAVRDACNSHGIEGGLMVTADRCRSPEEAANLASLAGENAGEGVVAFGLANVEAGRPASLFADAFEIARSFGLPTTPHAGEMEGPQSVWTAIEAAHPFRIQHGISAGEDLTLMQELADQGVALDVCLTSNIRLGAVESYAAHPLPRLLENGVPCSLNADNPTPLETSLLREYETARHEFGLGDEAIAGIAEASVTWSGADPESIRTWLAQIEQWLSGASNASISRSRGGR